jgi:hypothetical protein
MENKLILTEFKSLLTEYGKHLLDKRLITCERFKEDGKYGLKIIIYDKD